LVSTSLTVTAPPAAADALHFSTLAAPGAPIGAGTAGDIFMWDGLAFSSAITGPAGANVDGFSGVAGDFYMSFTSDVTLPGAGTVQKEDVVHFSGGTWTLFFDGSANGLTSNIDAISIDGPTLYFSTGDSTLPTGVGGMGDDADIYSWDGSVFARVFDATALGWSSNNVDGFVYVSPTEFYLSYSPTSTTVAGLGTVQDEDVIHYNAGVWSVYFDGTSKGLTSTAQDVDAFNIP